MRKKPRTPTRVNRDQNLTVQEYFHIRCLDSCSETLCREATMDISQPQGGWFRVQWLARPEGTEETPALHAQPVISIVPSGRISRVRLNQTLTCLANIRRRFATIMRPSRTCLSGYTPSPRRGAAKAGHASISTFPNQ
jgi:hypothetical protein